MPRLLLGVGKATQRSEKSVCGESQIDGLRRHPTWQDDRVSGNDEQFWPLLEPTTMPARGLTGATRLDATAVARLLLLQAVGTTRRRPEEQRHVGEPQPHPVR